MPYSISITPTAIDDIGIAVEYYNSLATDLGYRFADLISKYIDHIALTPTASAIRYKNVRCKPVRKFPFLITYTINEQHQSIIILRVFNTYLEPLW